MSQSCFSLKILSGSSLQYVGISVFILVCVWNAKGKVCNKQSCLATRAYDWNESRVWITS